MVNLSKKKKICGKMAGYRQVSGQTGINERLVKKPVQLAKMSFKICCTKLF